MTEPRILVIFGSPHPHGPTAALRDACLSALPAKAHVDELNCCRLNPRPCVDCRACYTSERCVLPDLRDFYPMLEQADGLVLATPVYNRSFPAPMKALLDRTQPYWSAKFVRHAAYPIARPKRTLLLTACGADGPDGGYLEGQLEPMLTVLNASLLTAVHYRGADRRAPMDGCLEKAAAWSRQWEETTP